MKYLLINLIFYVIFSTSLWALSTPSIFSHPKYQKEAHASNSTTKPHFLSAIEDPDIFSFILKSLRYRYQRIWDPLKCQKNINALTAALLTIPKDMSPSAAAETLKKALTITPQDYISYKESYSNWETIKEQERDALLPYFQGASSIVDIGCQNNHFLLSLKASLDKDSSRHRCAYIGTDIALPSTVHTNDSLHFMHQTTEDPPIANIYQGYGPISAVHIRNVMHHMFPGESATQAKQHFIKMFTQLRMFMKEGGYVVIYEDTYPDSTMPQTADEHHFLKDNPELTQEFMKLSPEQKQKFFTFSDWYWNYYFYGCHDMSLPHRYFSMSEWKEIFETSGFLVQKSMYAGVLEHSFHGSSTGFFVLQVPQHPQELMENIQKFLKQNNISDIRNLSPLAIACLIREARALRSSNISWLLRGILGKESGSPLTEDEIRLFFKEGQLGVSLSVYTPKHTPQGTFSKRREKSLPHTMVNGPFSPTLAEAITEDLLQHSPMPVNPDAVVGKYLCGTIPAALCAETLGIPLSIMTKYPLEARYGPENKKIKVVEPHNPESSVERYSELILPNTVHSVAVVDDESSSGKVHTLINNNLEQNDVTVASVLVNLSAWDEGKTLLQKNLGEKYFAQWSVSCNPYEERSDTTRLQLPNVNLSISSPQTLKCGVDPLNLSITHRPLERNYHENEMDHQLKGRAVPLLPQTFQIAKQVIQKKLEDRFAKLRQDYYQKGQTFYVLGLAPDGLLTALAASQATRTPAVAAADRAEPSDHHSLVVSFIAKDGRCRRIYGLQPGDGVWLAMGDFSDEDDVERVTMALAEHNICVHGILTASQNTATIDEKEVKIAKENIISLQQYSQEPRSLMNTSDQIWTRFQFAIDQLQQALQRSHPEASITKITAQPSSFTAGLQLEDTDIDVPHIYIAGIPPQEALLTMDNLRKKLMGWLTVSANTYYHINLKEDHMQPRLLQEENIQKNLIFYETPDIPQITIYENNTWINRNTLRAQTLFPNIPLSDFKFLPRLTWLVLSKRTDPAMLAKILESQDQIQSAAAFDDDSPTAKSWRIVKAYIQNLQLKYNEKRFLSRSAEILFTDLDHCRVQRKSILKSKLPDTEIKSALKELISQGLVIVYQNKLIIVWRMPLLAFDEPKFFQTLIDIENPDGSSLVKEIQKELMNPIPIYTDNLINLIHSKKLDQTEQALQTLSKWPKLTRDEITAFLEEAFHFSTEPEEEACKALIFTFIKNRIQEFDTKSFLSILDENLYNRDFVCDRFGPLQIKVHYALKFLFFKVEKELGSSADAIIAALLKRFFINNDNIIIPHFFKQVIVRNVNRSIYNSLSPNVQTKFQKTLKELAQSPVKVSQEVANETIAKLGISA